MHSSSSSSKFSDSSPLSLSHHHSMAPLDCKRSSKTTKSRDKLHRSSSKSKKHGKHRRHSSPCSVSSKSSSRSIRKQKKRRRDSKSAESELASSAKRKIKRSNSSRRSSTCESPLRRPIKEEDYQSDVEMEFIQTDSRECEETATISQNVMNEILSEWHADRNRWICKLYRRCNEKIKAYEVSVYKHAQKRIDKHTRIRHQRLVDSGEARGALINDAVYQEQLGHLEDWWTKAKSVQRPKCDIEQKEDYDGSTSGNESSGSELSDEHFSIVAQVATVNNDPQPIDGSQQVPNPPCSEFATASSVAATLKELVSGEAWPTASVSFAYIKCRKFFEAILKEVPLPEADFEKVVLPKNIAAFLSRICGMDENKVRAVYSRRSAFQRACVLERIEKFIEDYQEDCKIEIEID